MPQCDLCGRENAYTKAKIEGTLLLVCQQCAEFGEIIQSKTLQPISKKQPLIEKKKEFTIILPDYAQRIKTAREKAGLKQEELAGQLQEKVTVLQKIENGEVAPSAILAKKIETFFHITLVESYHEDYRPKENKKNNADELTIGDLLQRKQTERLEN